MSTAARNRYGRISRLELTAERSGDRTVLCRAYATSPFRIMKPFGGDAAEGRDVRVGQDDAAAVAGLDALAGRGDAPAAGQDALAGRDSAAMERAGQGTDDPSFLQVMAMSSSAGLLAGDEQRLSIEVGRDAALSVETQAFERVHRMEEGCARRSVAIAVDHGARLRFMQQPVVPYADSCFVGTTNIALQDATSAIAFGEVLCCGRVARGERFAFTRFENRISLCVGKTPIYADTTVLDPRDGLEDLGMFEGFTHLGTLVVIAPWLTDTAFEEVREHLALLCGEGSAPGGLRSRREASSGEEPAYRPRFLGGVTHLGTVEGATGWAVKLFGMQAPELQTVLDGVAAQCGFADGFRRIGSSSVGV
ncbi:urease accessory protein UreD [Collinsella sp. An2]|uniref:urease accessory protein UreD n=1 Tax=Collinsella sp. An2 TaxID=1965585 RepID=UPI000B376916|nr:urease accessory protein UreD [Collinsella sp. An2]OUP10960.1 hypothetical protein B5F33_00820 [Collinsella sp. An2]